MIVLVDVLASFVKPRFRFFSLFRHSKPFNPLLGETYEFVNHAGKYCVVSEQVSHHPPVTALHAESDKWIFWEEYKLDIKFRGQVYKKFSIVYVCVSLCSVCVCVYPSVHVYTCVCVHV